jgi:hypothetical protein
MQEPTLPDSSRIVRNTLVAGGALVVVGLMLVALKIGFPGVGSPALARDRERIREFASAPSGVGIGREAPELLRGLVDHSAMADARAEYSGPVDRWWRTPEALAREFVFRVGRPGNLELALAAALAEQLQRDADAAVSLVAELETAEAAQAMAATLWSDSALELLMVDRNMGPAACDAAISWGDSAPEVIAKSDAGPAALRMKEAAERECLNVVENEWGRATSLRSLVARSAVHSKQSRGAGMRSVAEQLALAKVSAQSAAISLSSIAEARLLAVREIHASCMRVSPKSITEFLDSFTGPWDTPYTLYKKMKTSEAQVVNERLQEAVLVPAEIESLPARVREVHATTVDSIWSRIRDECEGVVPDVAISTPSPEDVASLPRTEIDDFDVIVVGDLVFGTLTIVDGATAVAVALALIPEPTPITKVAAGLVLVGDVAWQATQVEEGLKRRAEQASHIHNGIARMWIGTPGLAQHIKLTDGTVVDRAHPPSVGVLFDGERRAFAHLREAFQAALAP